MIIEIKKLNKSFQQNNNIFYALRDINLSIKEGEFLILKGVSGSGKSTLLNIITSIMKPTSGAITIDGENIALLSDIHSSEYRKNRVGFITQSFHLFDGLSVEENLLAPLVIQKLHLVEINEKIVEVLKIVDILDKKKQNVTTLSGGEKQRVIIARAIINNPDIIICDEPTANLDRKNSLLFIETIKKLKDDGKTIIIATHDMIFDEVDFIDRTVLIANGEITN